MIYPWLPRESDDSNQSAAGEPPADLAEWAELFATTIAHLAAQLTMTQLRLRALGSVIAESGGADTALVNVQLASLAKTETGRYLRENLGPQLSEAVDVDALERQLVAFLRGTV